MAFSLCVGGRVRCTLASVFARGPQYRGRSSHAGLPLDFRSFTPELRRWPRGDRRAGNATFGSSRLACARCGCACSLPEPRGEHPFVEGVMQWSHRRGLDHAPVQLVRGDTHGWRTRSKLAVGSSAKGSIIGLFEVGSRRILSIDGCRAQHTSMAPLISELRQGIDELKVKPYDHDAHGPDLGGSLRHVQLTTERATGLAQLVLVWNGGPLEAPLSRPFVNRLWQAGMGPARWHSVWAHYRGRGPGSHGAGGIFATSPGDVA